MLRNVRARSLSQQSCQGPCASLACILGLSAFVTVNNSPRMSKHRHHAMAMLRTKDNLLWLRAADCVQSTLDIEKGPRRHVEHSPPGHTIAPRPIDDGIAMKRVDQHRSKPSFSTRHVL